MAPIPYSQRKQTPTSTKGGTGSFSYADTKVYAPGSSTAFWMQPRWRVNPTTGEVIDNGAQLWLPFGLGASAQIVPGQGGGAKLPGKRMYGGGGFKSDASTNLGDSPGLNPNGFVLIRLMKID
jgi:hypothetical protein